MSPVHIGGPGRARRHQLTTPATTFDRKPTQPAGLTQLSGPRLGPPPTLAPSANTPVRVAVHEPDDSAAEPEGSLPCPEGGLIHAWAEPAS
jgi:hypothetical protein